MYQIMLLKSGYNYVSFLYLLDESKHITFIQFFNLTI